MRRGAIAFDFPAKSGVRRELEIDDPAVVAAVRSLMRRNCASDRFLVVKDAKGWKDVHADDLNLRFKELVGDDYSVKDLRTWHGTVLAAAAFIDADPPDSKKVIKRVEAAVMKEVSAGLGNTPAVARASYVDPRVVKGYEQGRTIKAAANRADRAKDPGERQAILEKATRTLIQRVGKS